MSERRPVIFHRKFTKPGFRRYRAADPGWSAGWNRYDTATIGAYFVTPARWCYSFVWAKPVSEVLPR